MAHWEVIKLYQTPACWCPARGLQEPAPVHGPCIAEVEGHSPCLVPGNRCQDSLIAVLQLLPGLAGRKKRD